MEQVLTKDNIYDIAYDNYHTLQNILTNQSFDPNVILRDRGMELPAWVWVLFNSNDPDILHYILNNVNIKIDQNVNNQFVLDIAKNKDASVYERIRKYIGPFAGLEQASFIQLPYGLIDIIYRYGEEHSWKDIKLYKTIFPINDQEKGSVMSLSSYNKRLCIARPKFIYNYDLDKNIYINVSYNTVGNLSFTNIKLYQNILVGGGDGFYIIVNTDTNISTEYSLPGAGDIKVDVNDKYIVIGGTNVEVKDKNTQQIIKNYHVIDNIKSISLDDETLCIAYDYQIDIFKIKANSDNVYTSISTLVNQKSEKVCVKEGIIYVSTVETVGVINIRRINIYEIDLDDFNYFTNDTGAMVYLDETNVIENVHSESVNSLDVKNEIIMSSDDKQIKIWERKTLKLLKEITDINIKTVIIHNNNMIIYGLLNDEVKIYRF